MQVSAQRFYAKHKAREAANQLAIETGETAAVFLDSLGFIACLKKDFTRADAACVYTIEAKS